jgi:hypothetical protein
MNSESYRQSFIVRIWIEETAEEAGRAVWRGCIADVAQGPNATPYYIRDLDEISAYIAPFLRSMGVRTGRNEGMVYPLRRVRTWLCRTLGPRCGSNH